VTCIDARLNIYGMLGLTEGDAHIIRNAGGVITEDVVRSLAASQHLTGTSEIMLIMHDDCRMRTITDDEFADKLQAASGSRPGWPPAGFTDPVMALRRAMDALRHNPFLLNSTRISGSHLQRAHREPPGARARHPSYSTRIHRAGCWGR